MTSSTRASAVEMISVTTRPRRRRRSGFAHHSWTEGCSDGDGGGGGDRGGGTRAGCEPRGDAVRTREDFPHDGARPRDETEGVPCESETDGSETERSDTRRRRGTSRPAGTSRDHARFVGERRARVPRYGVRVPSGRTLALSHGPFAEDAPSPASLPTSSIASTTNGSEPSTSSSTLSAPEDLRTAAALPAARAAAADVPMVVKLPDVAGRSRFPEKIACAQGASLFRP